MNRSVFLLGLSLVAVGTLIAFCNSGEEGKAGGATEGGASANQPGKRPLASIAERSRKGVTSPEDAAKRLRHFLSSGLLDPPRFEDLDDLAKRLRDEDLRELIASVGLANMEGLVPWVRCALFAEWGRRDPEAAIAHLSDPGTEHNHEGWSARQAWFSLFRGWSENDPDRAFVMLQSKAFTVYHGDPFAETIETMMLDPYWQTEAHESVFRALARRDGPAAWERVPERGVYRRSAQEGLFWGIEDHDERLELISRWEPEWAAVRRNLINAADDTFGESGGAETAQDALGRSAALALAGENVERALDWIAGLDASIHNVPETTRLVLNAWAYTNPERALERLEDATQDETAPLVAGVVRGAPGLAPDVLLRIENLSLRLDVLLSSAVRGGPIASYFPAPGQANRLRNDVVRYEALSIALDAAGFDPESEAALQTVLDERFEGAIPGR